LGKTYACKKHSIHKEEYMFFHVKAGF